MAESSKIVDDSEHPIWLRGKEDPISRFFDKRKLTKSLESLSDHYLEDMGICRDSISEFVEAVTSTIDQECCKMICQRRIDDDRREL